MRRRDFFELWGGTSALIGVDAKYESGRLYVLHQFLLDNGKQLERLHRYLKDALLPALTREGAGPQIVLEAIVAAHQPQVLFVREFENVAAWRAITATLRQDPELIAANAAWDRPGPPYLSHNLSLLAGTNYCPELLANPDSPAGRIFEMRVYQAPSEWQLNGVHERFAGPEIPIFHRCGIHPVLYLSGIAGAQLPNLTYFTPFDSLAAREAAWTKFQGDPEWHQVRQHSIDQHGFTPRVITISLYKATAYSPVR
jgi:hypothetical protein